MQAAPGTGGEDAGVDLEMQVAVRVTGTGGVVPDDGGFDLLHRNLGLPAPRTHARGRMLCDPADDLARRAGLGGVVRLRDIGM